MMRRGKPYIQCGSSRPGEWVTPDCAACDLLLLLLLLLHNCCYSSVVCADSEWLALVL
jgi:hypothetical protein